MIWDLYSSQLSSRKVLWNQNGTAWGLFVSHSALLQLFTLQLSLKIHFVKTLLTLRSIMHLCLENLSLRFTESYFLPCCCQLKSTCYVKTLFDGCCWSRQLPSAQIRCWRLGLVGAGAPTMVVFDNETVSWIIYICCIVCYVTGSYVTEAYAYVALDNKYYLFIWSWKFKSFCLANK